ncbi:3' [Commensalibacter communis]|uniref:metallophosphoesterase family protein n=1 Tax=Commensalibacter communis TaxID=2972786 RepID=UPI0022FF5E81|nr:metallophosphoesterase [Commensalibacter communis]CAI3937529.1 3' [Commensalibacter communis]
MKRFTIAHISDIHLPLETIQFSKLSLCNKRFLSFLSWKKRRLILQKKNLDLVIGDMIAHSPDLVLISGDLTNLALPEEFKQAAEWLHQLPFPNVRVVPGNHDCLVKTQWHNTHAYWTPWTKAYAQEDYPIVTKTDTTAIIGISTGVPTLPFFASGFIGRDQLERIKEALRKAKEEKLFRIVMLHHPPVSGITKERKALRNRKELKKILLDEGADMILYGHTHKTTTTRFLHTNIPMLGIASASSNAVRIQRQAAWRKITLESQEDMLHVNFSVRTVDKHQQFIERSSFYLNHKP